MLKENKELIKLEIRLTAMDWGLVDCRVRKAELHDKWMKLELKLVECDK